MKGKRTKKREGENAKQEKEKKIDLTYLKRRNLIVIDKLFIGSRSISIIFIYFINLVFIYLDILFLYKKDQYSIKSVRLRVFKS